MGQLVLLLVCVAVTPARERYLLSPIVIYSRQDSWPWSHESRITGPTPHLMHHSRKWALHLTWAGQECWPRIWELWVSQPLVCEHKRAGPTSWLLCSGIDERDNPSPPFCPHYPLAEDRRASPDGGHESRRALPEPPCRRTQASRPCTSSGQHSRADPDSMSMGEPTLSCDRDEGEKPSSPPWFRVGDRESKNTVSES